MSDARACWFVGASFGRREDQVPRFLAEGIWEIRNPTPRESALVRSMGVGERIAIKASFTRKVDLPFDNRGQTVSVLSIKATGTISQNSLDGERIQVSWDPVLEPREWYFYTYRHTIWRVQPGEWNTDALIAFAFERRPQDIDRFCNAPFWRERFGSTVSDHLRFGWTKFYEAIADKLLNFRHDRGALLNGLEAISERVDSFEYLRGDNHTDGTKGFLRDICPFTVFGTFNRGITDENRKVIAQELASFLGVEEPIPSGFAGIPVLDNRKSWFFPYENARAPDHIDALWNIFSAALEFASSEDESARESFRGAFDQAMGRNGVAWNLTMGLYWIRPWSFLSLDSNSQVYLTKKLGVTIGAHGPKKRCDADDYLAVLEVLEPRFLEATYPVHSFPELSLEAWRYRPPTEEPRIEGGEEDGLPAVERPALRSAEVPSVPYSVDNLMEDGCFIDRKRIEGFLGRWRDKKNLILQGPPGTGKTWLAKRMAYALIGQRDESKVRAVQFHPNLSYEDFVRGWRPTGEGRLSLVDGVFMEAIKAASSDASNKFVVVIEEINRGNPAQVFGELLTLLEAGKRTPSEALELCYPDADGQRRPVHIPENLYVIGTMNIADRSLAMVDFALRRRFAFVDLKPEFGPVWRDWIVQKCRLDANLIGQIERRVGELNSDICTRLGNQFQIGHSYVTPTHPLEAGATRTWFQDVVETEIVPLLSEYWFDAPDEAEKAHKRLLQDW